MSFINVEGQQSLWLVGTACSQVLRDLLGGVMKAEEAVSTEVDAALQLASNSYAGLCYQDLVYKSH